MLSASIVLVSTSVVCIVWPYAYVSVVFIMYWMLCGSSIVTTFEFAAMYMFRLCFLV